MSSNPKDARELLAFYVDAGADALLGEEAIDRMADEVAASPPPAGGRPDSEAVRVGESNQHTVSDAAPPRIDEPAIGRRGAPTRWAIQPSPCSGG